MSQHPLNLGLRFLLELTSLYLLGMWGWSHEPRLLRLALAVLVPTAAAAAWSVFRVPNDGGAPVVTVPGPVRLALEALVLGGTALAAYAAGRVPVAVTFGSVVAFHYLLSWDRTARLLKG